jgi:uncharacterized protein
MHRRILKSVLPLALLILGLSATASAQNTISPEKRALIKEMIVATDAQKISDVMIKATMDQLENNSPKRIAESVNAMSDLTPEERKKMIQEMTDSSARFTKRFRELVKEKLDWVQLMEELVYPIVDKYYTEDDLRNMIAFYKSPTGKKVLEAMPQMMAEMITRSEEIIRPKIEGIVKQIQAEEEKRLKP